jgi:hypothetical protein
MSSITAQILIGSPHPAHDGIIPTHALFLQANSVPAWILAVLPLYGEHHRTHEIVWIPSLHDMLEDALLMIAVQILKDERIIALADSWTEGVTGRRVELPRLFSDEQRGQLHRECRQLPSFPKLVVTILEGSAVAAQLPVLERYAMDVEVCASVYQRRFSPRRAAPITRGSFPSR